MAKKGPNFTKCFTAYADSNGMDVGPMKAMGAQYTAKWAVERPENLKDFTTRWMDQERKKALLTRVRQLRTDAAIRVQRNKQSDSHSGSTDALFQSIENQVTARGAEGAMDSIATRTNANAKRQIAETLDHGITAEELDAVAAGGHNVDIVKALRNEAGASQTAIKFAKWIRGLTKEHIAFLNKQGFDVKWREDYFGQQVHRYDKIVNSLLNELPEAARPNAWKKFHKNKGFKSKADLDAALFPIWKEKMQALVDKNKSRISTRNEEQIYIQLWEGITVGDFGHQSGNLFGVKNQTGILENVSRLFEFKDAQSQHDFNTAFGGGTSAEMISGLLSRMAHERGVLSVTGAQPDRWLKMSKFHGVLSDKASGKTDKTSFLSGDRGAKRLDEAFDRTLGRFDSIEDHSIEGVKRAIQSFQVATKLGKLLIAQFGDLPLMVNDLQKNGMNVWQAHINAFIFSFKKGNAYDKMVATSYGQGMDAFVSSLSDSRLGISGHPGSTKGFMEKSAEFVVKASGANYWNRAKRAFLSRTMASNMAMSARMTPNMLELPLSQRDILKEHGISQADWRKIGLKAQAMDPSKPTEFVILPEHVGRKLGDKLFAYNSEQVDSGIMRPDAFVKRWMNMGVTSKGTGHDLVQSTVLQFLSFPITVTRKLTIRELMAKDVGDGLQGQRMREGAARLFGGVLPSALVTAVLADAARQVVSGKTPKSFTDEDGSINWSVWGDAFVRTGIAGIYADILMDGYVKDGSDIIGGLMGPSVSDGVDLIALLINAAQGDFSGRNLVRLIDSQIPNFPLLKPAMDWLLLNGIYEFLHPGINDNMENNLVKDGQRRFL